MTGKRQLSPEECADCGITFPCEIIRGQHRFRVAHEQGCVAGMIISIAGGWQNAHHSAYPHEVAAVHQGQVAIATLRSGDLRIQILRPGDYLLMVPGFSHNTYLWAGTALLYMKFGDCREGDWIANPTLDQLTKPLSEEDILRIAAACAEQVVF